MDTDSDEQPPAAYVAHMRTRGFELESFGGRGSVGSVYRAKKLSR